VKVICIFVAPFNPPAACAYGRTGFYGLSSGAPDEETEEWAYLGWEEMKIPKRF
jgi:hypothetical protein